jgi:MFS transporter, PAT family, beta-lactamase induction signal transducer AmpG
MTDNLEIELDKEEIEYPQKRFKFFVLFCLYAPSTVPMTFFGIVFPVMLRKSGVPLERIGLLGIFTIPFVLKFLWAPLVDRFGSRKFGHYKSWLISTQLFCVFIGCFMPFLHFKEQFWWIIALGMLFCFAVSTQWIAVNGLAVQCLSEKERPRGNSLAIVGSTIGVVTGGSMLILVDKIGYTQTLLLSLTLFILASIMLLFFKELDHPKMLNKLNLLSSFEPLKSASMRNWLLLMNLCIIGDSMIFAMVRPMLVDKGLSIDSIGLMIGTIRPVFYTLGAVVCSWIIKFFSRKTNLISFSIANAFFLSLFLLPALNITDKNSLFYIVAITGFINSFKWTITYSIFMDHARKSNAATDFAIQVSVISFGSGLYEICSGFLAAKIGYGSLFSLSIVLDIIGIIFVWIFYKDTITKKAPKKILETANFSELF